MLMIESKPVTATLNIYVYQECLVMSGNGGCVSLPRYCDLKTKKSSCKIFFPIIWESFTQYLN